MIQKDKETPRACRNCAGVPWWAKKARVLRLASLVGYQKGAVVSREIIRKDAGTVTVFSFAKGEGLSEHTAPFDALVYILDGRAQISISGKQHVLKKGELIVMPAAKPHALKAINKFKMLLVMVKGK